MICTTKINLLVKPTVILYNKPEQNRNEAPHGEFGKKTYHAALFFAEGDEKMFNVEGTTITMSVGDTGALKITANVTRRDTGGAYTFGERDRALFSIKMGDGKIVKQKSYQMTDNVFTVVFFNSDTDQLGAGSFMWDVRYIINPYYDTEMPMGPWPAYDTLVFPIAEGQKCLHDDVCYIANQDIDEEEEWTAAHWDEAWTDYSDLTFPVAAGTFAEHEGTYYIANQDISSSEDWTASHWQCVDNRIPSDGDQVITPNTPMSMNMLTIVGEI